jgi:hypothetical protein
MMGFVVPITLITLVVALLGGKSASTPNKG